MQEKLTYLQPKISVTLFSEQADVITASNPVTGEGVSFENYGEWNWF